MFILNKGFILYVLFNPGKTKNKASRYTCYKGFINKNRLGFFVSFFTVYLCAGNTVHTNGS